MSKISLTPNDSGTGTFTIQSPDSDTNRTLTLPDVDGALTTYAQAAGLSNRRLNLNGAMQVAQRGNVAGAVDQYGGPDRYQIFTNIGTLDLNQSTDSPDGFSNSLEVDFTAGGSITSSTYLQLTYRIEAQDVQHLKYGSSAANDVTLSFWVKTNKAGTFQANFRLPDSNKMASKAYTVNSADTWEYKTLTIAGNTADVIPNDTGNGFMLDFWLASGSDFDSGVTSETYITRVSTNYNAASTVDIGTSDSDYWKITGVQLEVGDTATPFEHRSYGDELARCQRYYSQMYYQWEGTIGATGNFAPANHVLPVTMRAAGTVTHTSAGYGGVVTGVNSSSIKAHGLNTVFVVLNTNGNGYGYYAAELSIEAEL